MNEIELAAMDALLAGDHPVLAVLRGQFAVATVIKREFTGAGFFTRFAIPAPAICLPLPGRYIIGDVYAELVGLQYPAGFILFVEDGAINTLECFIVDDAWPDNTAVTRIYHMKPGASGSSSLVETAERDLGFAIRERSTKGHR